MKYRLYVNGKCKNTRNFQSDIGIGGVILSDHGEETSFSRNVGVGTCSEAQIYAILQGIDEISKFNNATSIIVYVSNLMLVEYLNGRKLDVSPGTEILVNRLNNLMKNLKISIYYEYFEVNDYNYVRTLAEDALEL
ncbi:MULTISPECIES: reverse transcriptase-like protein [Clostridium]|uniref:reverse transcriptase-like protein n=1 Tax=Clostridium TaxID=1485 RepID=UPI0018971AA0|nr:MULTISPECIES: reverse transcriptase-like protein [Clostridium]MCR1952647.1 reverse transcriptase-like protein [Clostridium sp. DSM 100503]MDI9215459.1 reverse transcriptase-like protein [Clostridium tertium]